MNQEKQQTYWEQIRISTLVGCAGISGLFGLIFAPLFLSLIENRMFGSDYVYSFFARIHLADPLGLIYEPVIDILEYILP